jgi:hypothetical protein
MDRKPRRPFVRYVAVALLILFTPIFVLGATVAATGTIMVEVHEHQDGVNLFVPVPALLVDLAVMAAPHIIPPEELADMRREIAPWRDTIESIAEQLEDCPDTVLVEVKSRDENVRITKKNRSFYIAVDSLDANVNVTIPARLLSRALDVL